MHLHLAGDRYNVTRHTRTALETRYSNGPYNRSGRPCGVCRVQSERYASVASYPHYLPANASDVEDDKCLSVQCIYCQQIRAKNTSRQKQHLLECPGLANQPNAPRPQSSPVDGGAAAPNGIYGTPTMGPSAGPMTNGLAPSMQSTPLQNMASRPSLPSQSSAAGPSTLPQVVRAQSTPKPQKTPKSAPGSALPAPPLDDVHAAFVEFRAKEDDKCLSVQCIYCNQIRAKNTSRQRQHLQECPTYMNVIKDSIPANNLLHRFDEGDIARSLQLPAPSLELDFRMSVKLNPKVSVGPTMFGSRNWISFIGGQWAGRWGKGMVIVSTESGQGRPSC